MTPYNKKNAAEEVDIIQEWNAKGKFIYIILDEGAKQPVNDTNFQRSIWITLGTAVSLV